MSYEAREMLEDALIGTWFKVGDVPETIWVKIDEMKLFSLDEHSYSSISYMAESGLLIKKAKNGTRQTYQEP